MLVEGSKASLPPDRLREFAQAIVRSGALVRDLFQTVSDLQHIEQARLRIDVQEVDLALTDDRVELTVADDGPGIDPGRRSELSERGATTAAGAGVGLFVARHGARAHGGDLVLEDRAAGACFLLRLPR